ncbi:preprotein translocase subunit SecE [Paracoccus siganidrum]|uniref:Protein translocase subunit SecE n=1 Tax=Paracoccus siganidrum TaxID=1276757 RepID=A0A419A4G3_9RHOB|nr:preprotein translocase subunit SecE [Paracoccus siganidrum]RMC38992.1 preprotein translocase subunit SecE [Paracoccus siganidrum]
MSGQGLKRRAGRATSGAALPKEPTLANPVQFINQVRAELGKITWPTRREVVTTTIMVLILAALAAVFFSLVDLAIRFGITEGLKLISG